MVRFTTGNQRRGFRSAAQGFTLVEFTGALVIGLILTLMAMGAYRIFERELPRREAASRLAHCFSTARAFAIARNGTYVVRIDPNARNFWIDETDSAGNMIYPKITRPEEMGQNVSLGDIYVGTVRADDTLPLHSFFFFGDGSSDDARVTLRLREADPNVDANFDTVRLYGPTGMSRVFENQRQRP
jgi:Tfp pilus assembly protein PilE